MCSIHGCSRNRVSLSDCRRLQVPPPQESAEPDEGDEEARQDDGVLKGVDQWLGSYQDHQTALAARRGQHSAPSAPELKEKQSAQLGAAAWESQYQGPHVVHRNARFMQLAGSDDFAGAGKHSVLQDSRKSSGEDTHAAMQSAHQAAARLLQKAAQQQGTESHAVKRRLEHETDLLRMKLHSESARRVNQQSKAEGGSSFGWLWRS